MGPVGPIFMGPLKKAQAPCYSMRLRCTQIFKAIALLVTEKLCSKKWRKNNKNKKENNKNIK